MGLACVGLQDRSKNNVGRHDEHDEGSYHGDHSEMSEEEGFAGHTFEVKGRAVGRGDTDVDHPSDTLKHYGRHTNSFLKNQRRGNQSELTCMFVRACVCAWLCACLCVCVRVCVVHKVLLNRFTRCYMSV